MFKNTKRANRKIKNNFVMMMLISNILLILLILVPSYMTIQSKLMIRAEKYTQSLVNEQINKLEHDFIETSTLVNTLSTWIGKEFDLERGLKDDAYMTDFNNMLIEQLSAYLGDNKFNTSLYVYFNYGLFNKEYAIWYNRVENGRYELQPPLGADNYATYHAWYNEPIDNQLSLWTKPYTALFGPIAGRQLTSYVAPVIVNGQAVALVGVDLYIDEIIEAVKDIQIFESGYVYILQADGNTLYHPRFGVDSAMLHSPEYSSLKAAFKANDTGIINYLRDDNVQVYSAYGHLNNGWVIATSVPESEIAADVSELLKILFLVILLAMVIIFMITNAIGQRMSKPIVDLTKEMNILDSGNLSHEFSTDLLENKTEIGILTREANHMRIRLLDSFKEIEKQNNELESLVDERTLELQNALDQIQLNHHAIVEAERNKGMSALMKNFAHRLNTPLGTSITMTSYLRTLIESDTIQMDKIYDAMTRISQSQTRVTDIINQLGYILEPDKDTENIVIDIEFLFNKALTSLNHHSTNAFQITYDNQVKAPHLIAQVYLLQALSRMLTFILDYSKDPARCKIEVKAYDAQGLHIEILAHNIHLTFDATQLFSPYHSTSFDNEDHSLDMFIAYDLITRCMEGQIRSEIINDKTLKFYIDI